MSLVLYILVRMIVIQICNNLEIATNVGGFSASAVAGDMVLSPLDSLILLSGVNAWALIIDANNYFNINNISIVHGIANFHNGSP
jgi:hypothetical protein